LNRYGTRTAHTRAKLACEQGSAPARIRRTSRSIDNAFVMMARSLQRCLGAAQSVGEAAAVAGNACTKFTIAEVMALGLLCIGYWS